MSLSSKIHLRPGEEILEIVRRWQFTHGWRYIFGLALMTAASFGMFWLWAQGWWGWALYGAGMLGGLFFIFRTWFFNRANMLVITNERVVDVNRQGWLDETLSSVGYADIKDIYIRKKGLSAAIFNYGNLLIETASQKFALEMAGIRHPQQWLGVIKETMEIYRDKKNLNSESIVNNFIKIIPVLNEESLKQINELLTRQLNQHD